MRNLCNERLTFLDHVLLCEINLDDLMPTEVDEDYISSSGILPCPDALMAKSLISGFNIHSRVFSAALRPPGSDPKKHCICGHFEDPAARLTFLKEGCTILSTCSTRFCVHTDHGTSPPWLSSLLFLPNKLIRLEHRSNQSVLIYMSRTCSFKVCYLTKSMHWLASRHRCPQVL